MSPSTSSETTQATEPNKVKATASPVVADDVIDQVAKAHGQELTQQLTPEIRKALGTSSTPYSADCSITSVVFFARVKVTINNGKEMKGDAGGLGIGSGYGVGDVYTPDINALYSNTESFMWVGTPVYFMVAFFDSSHKSLGSFQGASLAGIAGTGGGKCSWK